MARIAPLSPLRYALAPLGGDLGRVVAPPYDVISPDERRRLLDHDPHNVVRLILPEGEGDAKYAHAASLLSAWRADGALVRDEEPGFYRLEQTFAAPGAAPGAPRVTRRGFLALVELRPFSDRVVLPHERTLSGPKEDRYKLFRATQTNLSPGFMLYRDPARSLDAAVAEGDVLARFTSADGVEHTVAKVRRPASVRAIVDGIARSTLLIADGHHRYETALRYGAHVTETQPDAHPSGEHRFFMTFLVNGDDPGLVVFPTHRHVHSLASFSFDDMLARVAATFTQAALPAGADAGVLLAALAGARGRGPSLVAAAPDGRATLLVLRADVDLAAHSTLGPQPAVLRRTDVAVLHAGLLEGVLGITPEAQAAKTNLWYPQDAAAALATLRAGRAGADAVGGVGGVGGGGSGGTAAGGDVLFLMNATPVEQVRAVAEAGEVMPQKSTFFHPKVPTGLAIHTLDPTRVVPGER
ncbi:MAG: DUF1015 domain-containing protein [Polyangiaceae bacterium]